MTSNTSRMFALLHDRLVRLLLPVVGAVLMLVLLASFSFKKRRRPNYACIWPMATSRITNVSWIS
jgi:hypothetical protein